MKVLVTGTAGFIGSHRCDERINPGDKQPRVTTIMNVTSESTPAAADFVNAPCTSIITATKDDVALCLVLPLHGTTRMKACPSAWRGIGARFTVDVANKRTPRENEFARSGHGIK